MSQSLANAPRSNPSILALGPGGTSKSTFFYRFASFLRLYVINADINMDGPKKVMEAEKLPIDKVLFDNLHVTETGANVEKVAQYERFAGLLKWAMNTDEIDMIILDSITSLISVFKAHVLKTKQKAQDAKLSFEEWDLFLYMWTDVISNLRKCGKTIVLIGHQEVQKDEINEKVLQRVLAMPGKAGTIIPISVTDMWLFGVENEVSGQPPMLRTSYTITTMQDFVNPGIKASLKVPVKFKADQSSAKMIADQLIPTPKKS